MSFEPVPISQEDLDACNMAPWTHAQRRVIGPPAGLTIDQVRPVEVIVLRPYKGGAFASMLKFVREDGKVEWLTQWGPITMFNTDLSPASWATICPRCEGDGEVDNPADPGMLPPVGCPSCGGTGRVKPCPHEDPYCPCPDGDPCHYEGDDAMECPHCLAQQ